MAAPVALLTFQVALVALSRRHRDSIAPLLRAASAAVYGRQLRPWQVRAYRYAAVAVLGVTIAFDVVFVLPL